MLLFVCPAANIFIGSLIFIEELADKIVEAVQVRGAAAVPGQACPAPMRLAHLGLGPA